MKVKKAMVVLAAALAGLGLTACGGGAKSTADGLEGKNISIMTPYLSSVTTNQMVENLQAGLEKEGAEVFPSWQAESKMWLPHRRMELFW